VEAGQPLIMPWRPSRRSRCEEGGPLPVTVVFPLPVQNPIVNLAKRSVDTAPRHWHFQRVEQEHVL
jgi:hypothetical protein